MLHSLVKKHSIEAIAIGNGTASRETVSFVRKIKLPPSILDPDGQRIGRFNLFRLGGSARNSPITTSPCVERFPSDAASWTRWPSW